ncbi:MAG: glycosyltransferase family 2 protein [Candidatus Bathyarchaeota archaeon]|nr:glycosyltransferase family 2 protein [Candidatus Bathyarchaeota archaeon]
MPNTISVLITCHNRKLKTFQSLQALFDATLPEKFSINVFLVDDGSTDGTTETVKLNFPQVNIIQGDGSLYWNQGMLRAWKAAANKSHYDFYLWLNDDTILDKDAILELIKCHENAILKDGKPCLITSACRKSKNKEEFSYGGRSDHGPLIPNGLLQSCKYINGNAVLVPAEIFEKVGFLSSNYTHSMGDYDYGLRAIQRGFKCYTTSKYIATCAPNEGLPGWCNPQNSFLKRWELLHSPPGLNLKEYLLFKKKFWGNQWIIFALKAYAKAIFPKLYSKFSL